MNFFCIRVITLMWKNSLIFSTPTSTYHGLLSSLFPLRDFCGYVFCAGVRTIGDECFARAGAYRPRPRGFTLPPTVPRSVPPTPLVGAALWWPGSPGSMLSLLLPLLSLSPLALLFLPFLFVYMSFVVHVGCMSAPPLRAYIPRGGH